MKKYILIASISAAFSILYIDFSEVFGYRFSLGIVMWVILKQQFKQCKPIKSACLTGGLVYLIRVCMSFVLGHYNPTLLLTFALEFCFYLVYGYFYQLWVKPIELDRFSPFIFYLMICDLLANLAELSLRVTLLHIPVTLMTLQSMIIVSIIRSTVVCIALYLLIRFDLVSLKRYESQTNDRLVWLLSQIELQSFLINKNANYIESVTNDSYQLYHHLKQDESLKNSDIEKQALHIARNVHEIKKDYLLTVNSFKELETDRSLISETISLRALSILINRMFSNQMPAFINLAIDRQINFDTREHYRILTIIRNLLNNAIEAAKPEPHQTFIRLTLALDANDFLIGVSDNGIGMEPAIQAQIFQIGFSTKINYETGEVSRGLGLSLVVDIVEHYFKGSIHYTSQVNQGTEWIIRIPSHKVVYLNEYLSD